MWDGTAIKTNLDFNSTVAIINAIQKRYESKQREMTLLVQKGVPFLPGSLSHLTTSIKEAQLALVRQNSNCRQWKAIQEGGNG